MSNKPFTQEELVTYFNIVNPAVCRIHHKPAKVYYENGMFKLDRCCEILEQQVIMQIAERISNVNHE